MKRFLLGSSFVLIVIVATLFYLRYSADKKYEQSAQSLITKIETYKQQHGILPNSETDLEYTEGTSEGPYYKLIDSTAYIVFFNIGFDESKVYDSKSKKWQDKP